MRTRARWCGALFAAAGMAFIADSHAANDGKSFHGAFCVPSTPAAQRAKYSEFGASCYSTCDLTCPMTRDWLNDADTLSVVRIEVYNNPSDAETYLPCTLYSQREDTTGGVYDSELQSTSTTGHRRLTYTTVSSTAGNEGAYALECHLGVGDSIHHYYMRETNSAGGVD